ncbi:LAQU0S20e00738g1_1 [Lachancea quebecensis]|uniref:Golgi apparatus membrane protein TVP38 n=1 Tax=Lachancea quebecensis TaxID=1654605 RepID=A0A0P1KX08_9SACH|nr:LAQU0S20e00738g1_1 [Lachancea quebecensis]
MAEAYEAQVSSNGSMNEESQGIFASNDDFEDLDDNFLDMYTMNPRQRLLHQFRKIRNRAIDHYHRLPAWKKALLALAAVAQLVLVVLVVVYHNRILKSMVNASNELKTRWYTPFLFCALVFAVSFPPLIGFSLLSVTVGIIYGLSFRGWLILFLGSVGGSVTAFVLFKTILHSQAERLVHANAKFEALASILQDNDSYMMLALIRLCPFPYSFTNGAIAGIYGVTLRNFSAASILTSPKLLMYLFVGSRLKNLGESQSTASWLFDVASILLTGAVLALTTWILYTRARKRYQELQRSQDLDTSFENIF